MTMESPPTPSRATRSGGNVIRPYSELSLLHGHLAQLAERVAYSPRYRSDGDTELSTALPERWDESLQDTYQSIGSLAAGLSDYRLELSCTEEIVQCLPPSLFTEMLHIQDPWKWVERLIALASRPSARLLRKAIFEFVRQRPSLHWILKPNRASGKPCPAAAFSAPTLCIGRDKLIAHVSALITGETHGKHGGEVKAAILVGAGGVGKTTVALAVLHDPGVMDRFNGRRFLVKCEGVPTADDLVRHLGTQLELNTLGNARQALGAFAHRGPSLLVLSGLDDLLSSDGVSDVLDLLRDLMPPESKLKLLLTMRSDPRLALPLSEVVPVEPLGLDAASKVLAALIRDKSSRTAASDLSLQILLKHFTGSPLGLHLVRLVARRLDPARGITAAKLTDELENSKVPPATFEHQDRFDSILIELSLGEESMVESGGRDLCYLLSILPDGADDQLMTAFLERRARSLSRAPFDLQAARKAALDAGLASDTFGDILQMEALLRECLGKGTFFDSGCITDARHALRSHACTLIAPLGDLSFPYTEKGDAATEKALNQLGNLEWILIMILTSNDAFEVLAALQLSAELGEFVLRRNLLPPRFLGIAIDSADHYGFKTAGNACRKVLTLIETSLKISANVSAYIEGGLQGLPTYTEATAVDEVTFDADETLSNSSSDSGYFGRLDHLMRLIHKVHPEASMISCNDETADQIIEASGESFTNFEELKDLFERRTELYKAVRPSPKNPGYIKIICVPDKERVVPTLEDAYTGIEELVAGLAMRIVQLVVAKPVADTLGPQNVFSMLDEDAWTASSSLVRIAGKDGSVRATLHHAIRLDNDLLYLLKGNASPPDDIKHALHACPHYRREDFPDIENTYEEGRNGLLRLVFDDYEGILNDPVILLLLPVGARLEGSSVPVACTAYALSKAVAASKSVALQVEILKRFKNQEWSRARLKNPDVSIPEPYAVGISPLLTDTDSA